MFLSLDLLWDIGFNTMPTDPFMITSCYSTWIFQGSFRLCNWLSLRINHLPPACWSTFRKSNSTQQLGCRFDIMDYESYIFVFWHMQLYMSWSSYHFSVLPKRQWHLFVSIQMELKWLSYTRNHYWSFYLIPHLGAISRVFGPWG